MAPVAAIVRIAFGDDDVGRAHLYDWVLLVDQLVEGSEDRHFPPFPADVFRHLEQVVDQRDVSMVEGAEQGFELRQGDHALQVNADDLDDIAAPLMLLYARQQECILDFLDEGDWSGLGIFIWDWGGSGLFFGGLRLEVGGLPN